MIKLILLVYFISLVLGSDVKAQTVANGWIIEEIHGPSQVGIVDTIPVDLNQDGLMDVVSASIEDGHLRAYINQGNYQFEQQYISKDVPGIYRISATDINNDGKLDFLLPSIETHEVIILINQNDHYKKQIIASGVILPTDAQAADFNLDGLLDVVSISFENHELLLHLQQANGSFQTKVMSFSAQRPRKLQVNDFNNDGFADILLASSGDDSVRLFSNQGSAVFAEHLISNLMTGTRFVTECNFNNDELMDFVVSATDDDTVYVFANIGNNLFEPKPVDNNLPGVNALHCADIDNDQQTELVSVASNSGNIYTHELSADLERQLIANTRDGYVTVSVATFEQNQPLQILTQAHFENRNLLYSINTAQETVVWEDFPDGAYFVEKGDLDNDGDLDLIYVAFREDKLFWSETSINKNQVHLITDKIDGPQSISIGDLDSDGDLDLVTAGAWDDKFWVHYNNGDGLFLSQVLLADVNNPARSLIVDMNGDELSDVILTSSLDNSVILLMQDSTEQFTVQFIDNDLKGAYDIEVLDVNDDKKLDLIAIGLRDARVKLYLQNDSNQFSITNIYTKALSSNAIQSLDYVGSDLPDVALISDKQMINLKNQNGLVFEIIKTFLESMELLDFIIQVNLNDWIQVLGTTEAGHILVSNSSANAVIKIEHKFKIRSLASSQFPHMFFAASSQDNSIKLILKDLIMGSTFESSSKSFDDY